MTDIDKLIERWEGSLNFPATTTDDRSIFVSEWDIRATITALQSQQEENKNALAEMLRQATTITEQATEIANLKEDINTYIQISTDGANEIERLRDMLNKGIEEGWIEPPKHRRKNNE